MKRTKLIALILAALMIFMMLPTYAGSSLYDRDAEEHVFTFEELAWMITPENAEFFSEEFIEIKKIESEISASSAGGLKASANNTQTVYYIIETEDGYMLSSPSSGAFSRTRYSAGNSNSHLYQKWIFDKGTDGYYTVYSNTDSARCLTVNPSTKVVTLAAYTGSQYQKWKMLFSSGGNALASAATDTAVKDYKLKIASSSCTVSNTGYTPIGFFDVSRFVPVTSLSHADFYLAPGQSRYVYPNKTPSNANGCSNNWLKWSVSPVNSMPAVVSSDGMVTGGTPFKSAQLSFTNKITRVSGSCLITITEIANGTYYLKNKQNSNYAKVKSGTMTNGQNVVQYDLEGGNAELWIFTLNTATGYYSIKSANSGSTSYYMTVSDDATTVGKPIVIRSATESTLTNGMKWRVEKTASGAYKLCPKTGEANGYVLNTSTASGSNNANLTQDTYVQNTSYRDEWYFQKIYANSMGGEFHSGADVIDASVNWRKCGYNSYYDISPSVSDLTQNFLGANIVYFSSHGAQHLLQLYNNVYITDGLTTPPNNSVKITDYSLDISKLYIYDACYTASNLDGSGKNLCTQTLSAGAETVIGWTQSISVTDARNWQQKFQSKLVSGSTVLQAANYANTFSYINNTAIKSWLIYGNSSLIINPDYPMGASSASAFEICNYAEEITYLNYTIDKPSDVYNIVKNYSQALDKYSYTESIAYTNLDKTSYVIDYVLTINGFKTDYAITVIVDNGVISQIADRTSGYETLEKKITPNISNISLSSILSEASERVRSTEIMCHTISEQSYDLYYNADNNTFYYRVMTVYTTETGEYGAIHTLHEITGR